MTLMTQGMRKALQSMHQKRQYKAQKQRAAQNGWLKPKKREQK